MPWKETCRVEQRIRFIEDRLRGAGMSALCRSYGISRKTGYKWIERFRQGGQRELADRPSARKTQAHRIDPITQEALLALRREHPTWGPKKLRARLLHLDPDAAVPAASTIGDLLKRAGLVRPRRRRRRLRGADGSAAQPGQAGGLWNVDFKGQFRLGDRSYCYPLTVTEAESRCLLCCKALASVRGAGVRSAFERVFREHGLPAVIRSDNGQPFAAVGAGRLSRLSVWWLRLGIGLARIAPGKPQENGSHERMHRTLKAETTRPPERSLAAQQRRFDAFIAYYNEERPHEALEQRTPWSCYAASPRAYPKELPEPEYPSHWEQRRVRNRGQIKLGGRLFFLSEALTGELVGLVETDDGLWRVEFCGHAVAMVNLRAGRVEPLGVYGCGSGSRRYVE